MMTVKKTQSLEEALEIKKVEKEEKAEKVEVPDPAPVWKENPEHALGKLHPDFEPQKMSPDNVGYPDE